jgi:Bacterial Ig domain
MSLQLKQLKVGQKMANKECYDGCLDFSATNPLLAEVSIVTSQKSSLDVLSLEMREVAEEAKKQLNLSEGDYTMFPLDLPPQAPQSFVIAAIEQAKQAQENERVIGYCHPVPNMTGNHDAFDSFPPTAMAMSYFKRYEQKTVNGQATITVLEQPKHGSLSSNSNDYFLYAPAEGYFGKDQVTYLVEIGGYKVKVIQFIKVINKFTLGNTGYERNCADTGTIWKISTTPTTNPETNFANLLNDAIDAFTGFRDLAGTTVGETTGLGLSAQITFDSNAAGHGWLVDLTPLINHEFLPTADANKLTRHP